MKMKLSKDREQLVLDNRKLVFFVLKKFGITRENREYDDLVSIGTIGLIKSAITYNISKGNTFSTYAIKCIKNEIIMYFMNENKHNGILSLNDFIKMDNENTDKEYEYKIADLNSFFVDDLIDREEFIYILSIILNCLAGNKRIAILFSISDMTQQEIGYEMNVTRSHVSKLIKKAINEIRKIVNLQLGYYEIFSVSADKNTYKICFSIEDIDKFKEMFTMLLEKNIKTEIISDFSISFKDKQIIIQFPACEKSFPFIAKMFQEIDELGLSLSSSDIKMLAKNNQNSAKKADKKEEVNSSNVTPSKTEQIRDYILSKDSFCIDELKSHFFYIPRSTIITIVFRFKKKNLITCVSRGKYTVNKA